jgi:hypothetical protein
LSREVRGLVAVGGRVGLWLARSAAGAGSGPRHGRVSDAFIAVERCRSGAAAARVALGSCCAAGAELAATT